VPQLLDFPNSVHFNKHFCNYINTDPNALFRLLQISRRSLNINKSFCPAAAGLDIYSVVCALETINGPDQRLSSN